MHGLGSESEVHLQMSEYLHSMDIDRVAGKAETRLSADDARGEKPLAQLAMPVAMPVAYTLEELHNVRVRRGPGGTGGYRFSGDRSIGSTRASFSFCASSAQGARQGCAAELNQNKPETKRAQTRVACNTQRPSSAPPRCDSRDSGPPHTGCISSRRPIPAHGGGYCARR